MTNTLLADSALLDLRRTALYRLFDAANALLYVGISVDLGARLYAHSGEKVDWSLVVRVEVEHFDTRDDALAAEVAAIKAERPRWNIQHNGKGRRPVCLSEDQERSVGEAEHYAIQARMFERAMWLAILRARLGGVPDEHICDRTGASRATLNRRYGPRTAMVIKWNGDNLNEIQLIRPDARLNAEGALEVDRVDGGRVVIPLHHLVQQRDET